MKTLILVLFLSPCAWGQIPDSTISGRILYKFHDWRAEEIADSIRYERAMENHAATIFLRLWDEYEKECYDDSTQKRIHKRSGRKWCAVNVGRPGTYLCVDGVSWDAGDACELREHWRTYWTHSKPTFPGFMAHLKRRGK